MKEERRGKAITVTTYLDAVAATIRVATPSRPPERGAVQPPALSRGRNLRLAESQFSKCCGVPSLTRGEGVRGVGFESPQR